MVGMFLIALFLFHCSFVAGTSAALDGSVGEETGTDEACALQVRTDAGGAADRLPEKICALCYGCGGDFPEYGGSSPWHIETWIQQAYDEACTPPLRTYGPDSLETEPSICCTRPSSSVSLSSGLIQAAAKTEAGTVARAADAQEKVVFEHELGFGWCRICEACGGEYPAKGGTTVAGTWQGAAGTCSDTHTYGPGGSEGSVCCKAHQSKSVCAMCAGSCGGDYPTNGGFLQYVAESSGTRFEGYGPQCQGELQNRIIDDSQTPRFCCMSR